ncbi:HIT family protein [Streptomyces griseoluteus]|uniref:HIT family protein n=1 Tax=Streptomyces griseoluteus TaxID=29306 RepID=A0A4Z1DM15_STRGP|nr:HIT family protein [Streptomyces griseoluteus]GHE92408.1 protein hit [Streptomyces griseoluteus]
MVSDGRGSTCPFCEIAEGRSPADRVYETPEVLAFLPLSPATTGHTLIIPKLHITDLWHADTRSLEPVMAASLVVAQALKTALSPDGLNLINSAGTAATQTVFHLHIHLVPRWDGDQMGDFWPESTPWSESKRATLAERIRKSIH